MTKGSPKQPRRTTPRLRAATALKLTRSAGGGYIDAQRVSEVAKWGTGPSMLQVLNGLFDDGFVAVSGVRPKRFRITEAGLIWMGSFPDRVEETKIEEEEREC